MNISEISKLKYESSSHSMNKLVLAAYKNLFKNKVKITDEFISIESPRRTVVLNFTNKNLDSSQFKNPIIYSEKNISNKYDEEIIYDIEKIINLDSREIRRGLRFEDRPQVKVIETTGDMKFIRDKMTIFKKWDLYKKSDPKVFQMLLNSNRYKRAIGFKSTELGENIKEFICYINGKPWAYTTLSIQNDTVFAISSITLFFDKKLRIVADMSEMYLLTILKKLHEQGFKYYNYGPDGGIKGLGKYKKQFPYEIKKVYIQEK